MSQYRFIDPLDVLYVRGNKLFGAAGDHGAALMPPWPSLAAGALRSRMLVDHGIDPAEFAAGHCPSGALGEALGTVTQPGRFRVNLLTLAQRDGTPYFPLPADTVVIAGQVACLQPRMAHRALQSSYPLPQWPMLQQASAGKPESGWWLTLAGLNRWLAGGVPQPDELIASHQLWRYDARLGIALESHARTAATGQIYTAEAVALSQDIGFLVGVDGVEDPLLPASGLLRFGGDGRGAQISPARAPQWTIDWARIDRERRFKVMTLTPGLFANGWIWLEGEDGLWRFGQSQARCVAACVQRAEVVSGWDLANQCPKPAQRTVPVGAVYWFEDFTGDIEALRQRLMQGLPGADASRQAEGFNHLLIAAWPQD
jgi:CRISPR-associated protein Cmr3